MDKKTTMKLAFEYLKKDLLYGKYNDKPVMEYLLEKADIFVKDDMDPVELARKIELNMYDEKTGEPIYTRAYERATNPLGAVLDVSLDDKKDYIEMFILDAPYVGDIAVSKDRKINIASELRSKLSAMDDEYNVIVDFDGNKKTLQDIYKTLLDNEYIPVTKMDKIEVIMEGVRNLRSKYPDFEKMGAVIVGGKNYIDAIKPLMKMNDEFMIQNDNGEMVLVTDQMYKIFEKYKNEYYESMFNSVGSNPMNVEPITLGRNEENKLEVTSNYIFMNEDETSSVLNSTSQEEINVKRNMNNILESIRLAKSLEQLDELDIVITDNWNDVKEAFPNNEEFKTLHETMIYEATNKRNELSLIQKNEDDAEILLRNELRELVDRIRSINIDFTHTYEDPSNKLEDIRYDLTSFRRKVEGMNIKMSNEIEAVSDELSRIEIQCQYTIENVNHIAKRKQQDIEDLMNDAYFAFRRIDNSTGFSEKAAAEVNCQKLTSQIFKLIDDYRQQGYITDDQYEEYRIELNRKLLNYGMDMKERR